MTQEVVQKIMDVPPLNVEEVSKLFCRWFRQEMAIPLDSIMANHLADAWSVATGEPQKISRATVHKLLSDGALAKDDIVLLRSPITTVALLDCTRETNTPHAAVVNVLAGALQALLRAYAAKSVSQKYTRGPIATSVDVDAVSWCATVSMSVVLVRSDAIIG